MAGDSVDAAVAAELDASEFEVYADNEETVSVFVVLGSQWRVVPTMGGVVWQGLDYGSIPATLALMRIDRARHGEIFAGLRAMESAALAILNKRDDG